MANTLSLLTCPICGFAKIEHMPEDSCLVVYECSSCGEVLRPRSGQCCVFCSYGSVPCPPMQDGSCPPVD
ncbi:MAG: GDCCVxC domain-containing (seleno)protein [Alphaproteobacteria bacterium]